MHTKTRISASRETLEASGPFLQSWERFPDQICGVKNVPSIAVFIYKCFVALVPELDSP